MRYSPHISWSSLRYTPHTSQSRLRYTLHNNRSSLCYTPHVSRSSLRYTPHVSRSSLLPGAVSNCLKQLQQGQETAGGWSTFCPVQRTGGCRVLAPSRQSPSRRSDPSTTRDARRQARAGRERSRQNGPSHPLPGSTGSSGRRAAPCGACARLCRRISSFSFS